MGGRTDGEWSFIIQFDQIHPMACIILISWKISSNKGKMNSLTHTIRTKKTISFTNWQRPPQTIAAAFYPKDVIVRWSWLQNKWSMPVYLAAKDIWTCGAKSNDRFFRGASRYYHALYKDAFVMECEQWKWVRDEMGFYQYQMMVPFVRNNQKGGRPPNPKIWGVGGKKKWPPGKK